MDPATPSSSQASACSQMSPMLTPKKTKKVTMDEVITQLETFTNDNDTLIRAAMYSITVGEKQIALDTLSKAKQRAKATVQKASFHLKNIDQDHLSNQQVLKLEKMFSNDLKQERQDLKRKLNAAIKERENCKKSLTAALGEIIDDEDDEYDDDVFKTDEATPKKQDRSPQKQGSVEDSSSKEKEPAPKEMAPGEEADTYKNSASQENVLDE